MTDQVDENRFIMEAWGAQMELRAIQRRNRSATQKTQAAGRPKGKPSYGFQYVWTVMGGKIDHVALHPHASTVIRTVARRILADPEDITPSSEAARLSRVGERSPTDHLAVMYGKPASGHPWQTTSLKNILFSEAALGYLMHQGRPVIDWDGNPVRLCEGLWERPTHEALRWALIPRRTPWIGRRTNRDYLLTELALCGQCHNRLYTQTSQDQPPRYVCTARNKGWLSAKECRPAPLIRAHLLDAYVEEWFLQRFGDGMIFETVYDEGNGVAELRASRERLRADRETGLYDASDDAVWFREKYAAMGHELADLALEPERTAGMVRRPRGETVQDRWDKALDVQARKEILMDFGVRVTLYPNAAPLRWVAGLVHGPERDPAGVA
ncbi:recombinase zinc beta ribbon domain-containing protein [Streptomyces tendae]|uniref:recombinase zinc beta ribbon domain-containing protein n=1 Tax=Streptomyces tendae TaxID=1932 RepID=UPI00364C1939